MCPNLALQTYRTAPFEAHVPELRFESGKLVIEPGEPFCVAQPYQVAVLTDFCNECGNCTTFCPTSGRPFRDKPRLYLNREDFEAQQDNAFMVFRKADAWSMDARRQGLHHRIELNGNLDYTGPAVQARLDPATFDVVQAEVTDSTRPLTLEPCAEMFVLLKGLQQSLHFLPTAIPAAEADRGRIPHPGYEE